MKRLLSAVLVLTFLLAALLAAGSLRWRPPPRAGPPRLEGAAAGAGPLSAGAAEVPLDFPAPLPVAGFFKLDWSEEGQRDPVSARALVLSEPGCAVALVSVEVMLVSGELARAVEEHVRDLRLDAVVLAATHTHAGPGGYRREAAFQRAATGPYRRAVFDGLADRIAEAVRRAAAARGPALLSAGRAEVPMLARNRHGGEVDGRLLAMRIARPSGALIAEVVVYPAHATFLGPQNRRISGDWPGELMRSRPATALFLQGALGDQSPHGGGAAAGYARALASELDRLRFGPAEAAPALRVASTSVVLPSLELWAVPPLLRPLASNLAYGQLPARGRVAALRLGSVLLVAVPGEPVAAVGRSWRDAAGRDAEVVSLAGDYLGYVETAERMAEGGGETVHTYYGPELAERLGVAVATAAADADARSPASPGR